jgi:hypothetical protein
MPQFSADAYKIHIYVFHDHFIYLNVNLIVIIWLRVVKRSRSEKKLHLSSSQYIYVFHDHFICLNVNLIVIIWSRVVKRSGSVKKLHLSSNSSQLP